MLNNSELLILLSKKGATEKSHKNLIPWVYGNWMDQVH